MSEKDDKSEEGNENEVDDKGNAGDEQKHMG
jgi:hypothetical protein